MPPEKKRFKVEYPVCNTTFDSDYRRKHNELCHNDQLKAHKQIGYKVTGAPNNKGPVIKYLLGWAGVIWDGPWKIF